MSAAGPTDPDSGRPDSCQAVAACPLPPFAKLTEEPLLRARILIPAGSAGGPRTAASPKGLKSLPEPAVGKAGAHRRQKQAEFPVPRPGSLPAGRGLRPPAP